MDKLVRVRRLLQRLDFLFQLPQRLEEAVQEGQYAKAIRYCWHGALEEGWDGVAIGRGNGTWRLAGFKPNKVALILVEGWGTAGAPKNQESEPKRMLFSCTRRAELAGGGTPLSRVWYSKAVVPVSFKVWFPEFSQD